MANGNGAYTIFGLTAAGVLGYVGYQVVKGMMGSKSIPMESSDMSHLLVPLNNLPGTPVDMGAMVSIGGMDAHEFIANPLDFYPGAYLLLDHVSAAGRQIVATWSAYVPSNNPNDLADVRLWHEGGGRVVGGNTPMPRQDAWVSYVYTDTVLPDAGPGLWLKFNARASSISITADQDIATGQYDRIYIRDLVVGLV